MIARPACRSGPLVVAVARFDSGSVPTRHRYSHAMPITKDEASDLRSHLDRVVQTEKAAELALAVRDLARGQLESFVWKLEHEKAV